MGTLNRHVGTDIKYTADVTAAVKLQIEMQIQSSGAEKCFNFQLFKNQMICKCYC